MSYHARIAEKYTYTNFIFLIFLFYVFVRQLNFYFFYWPIVQLRIVNYFHILSVYTITAFAITFAECNKRFVSPLSFLCSVNKKI